METVHRAVEIVVVGISIIGALVTIWGVIEAVIGFLSLKLSRAGKDEIIFRAGGWGGPDQGRSVSNEDCPAG